MIRMKPAKSSHKPHKSSKLSPMRKDLSKKPGRSRSPIRISRNSRAGAVKHLSPGMKRVHPLGKRKSSHSPRMRSIASSPPHRSVSHRSNQDSPVSIDRVHTIKRHKYEKRKSSPVRGHQMSTSHGPTARESRSISPYQSDHYLNSRSAVPASHYVGPAKKKQPRRAPETFHPTQSLGAGPIPRHSDTNFHLANRLPRRNESVAGSPPGHHRSHIVHDGDRRSFEMGSHHRAGQSSIAPSHSKDVPPIKSSYGRDSDERYRSISPSDQYASGSEKSYVPTLHERFSSVVETNHAEPRIKYSREDLEKITIDVRCNTRDQSPPLRRIMNPSDIKHIRRADEMHRPVFDREEIKPAPRDLREGAYHERKVMSGGGLYNSVQNMDPREAENYEIAHHRFDAQRVLFNSGSGRTLSDRWQNPEGRKADTSLDRDEREREYQRSQITRSFDARSRSRSGDRDFRPQRFSGGETTRGRSEYQDNRTISPPMESRRSISVQRKNSVLSDTRHRLTVRRGSERESSIPGRSEFRNRYHSPVDRHISESISGSRIDRHRSPDQDSRKWSQKSRSHSREKLPDFSRRPDKYSYKPWIERPDVTPRGPSYFEHDNREGADSYRGRGSSRPFRSSRGFRSRGYRGPIRGGLRYRGSFRGFRTSSSPRGRGSSRRGRFSPSLWEHDLYSRSSQDRKSGSHAP